MSCIVSSADCTQVTTGICLAHTAELKVRHLEHQPLLVHGVFVDADEAGVGDELSITPPGDVNGIVSIAHAGQYGSVVLHHVSGTGNGHQVEARSGIYR